MTHQIRVADRNELPTVAANFRQMWLDLGSAPDTIVPGWRQQTEQFLDDAIRDREGRAFVALEEGQILGSAAFQLVIASSAWSVACLSASTPNGPRLAVRAASLSAV